MEYGRFQLSKGAVTDAKATPIVSDVNASTNVGMSFFARGRGHAGPSPDTWIHGFMVMASSRCIRGFP